MSSSKVLAGSTGYVTGLSSFIQSFFISSVRTVGRECPATQNFSVTPIRSVTTTCKDEKVARRLQLRPAINALFLVSTFSMGPIAAAQAVTGSGTANTVPVFSGTSTVENSPISVSGSNVGIGTTSPTSQLHIFGAGNQILALQSTTAAFPGMSFANLSFNYTNQLDANNGSLYWFNGSTRNMMLSQNGNLQVVGNVMVGTSAPNCDSPSGIEFYGAISNLLLDCAQNVYLLSGLTIDSSGQAVAQTGSPVGLYTQNDGFHFQADTGKSPGVAYTPTERLTILSSNGNVGIGTTSPAYSLDVTGTIRATQGIVFPDGSTQSTAFSPTLCGGDYAESVDVSDDRTRYQPGDILVLDPESPGKILKSTGPYSTFVSGIYSTKPGVIGRRQLTEKTAAEIPMAMVGIVPTKVSTENGSIRVGDLLVSSSTPGYAMKGTDHERMLGAVIGKAMGNLDSGAGLIEVLVSLQ